MCSRIRLFICVSGMGMDSVRLISHLMHPRQFAIIGCIP